MLNLYFKTTVLLLSVFLQVACYGQNGWQWAELADMPEPVSNNAVAEGYCGDTLCVYSFTGIGSELNPQAIHLKSWRYNSISNVWQQLPDIADELGGKIAAGASTVNNKIYIIGGYHVEPNFNEITSAKVHRFDPEANEWMTDGTDVPTPIDDHVQVVWRDSLIYTVTGWNTNTNITNVQIYNPALDTWTEATSVPVSHAYRAFGASGVIVGDTIFYYGGTQISGFNFVANNNIRKGVINPSSPTEIEWDLLPETEFGNGYRTAAFRYGENAVWLGGSATAYNFDGLAYSNAAGVEPETIIRIFNTETYNTTIAQPTPFGIMDFRGIAKESDNAWIIAGGMSENQEVSSKTYRLEAPTVGLLETNSIFVKVSQLGNVFQLNFEKRLNGNVEVFNLVGKRIKSREVKGDNAIISLLNQPSAIYFICVTTNNEERAVVKVWNP